MNTIFSIFLYVATTGAAPSAPSCNDSLAIRTAHVAVVCVHGWAREISDLYNAKLVVLAREFGALKVDRVETVKTDNGMVLLCARVKPRNKPDPEASAALSAI